VENFASAHHSTMSTFVSGQQTKMAYDILKGCLASMKVKIEDADIKASCPRFNVRGVKEWEDLKIDKQDLPVYGPAIQAASVERLQSLDPKRLRGLAKYVSLEWTLDTFVQSKMKKVQPLLKLLNDRSKAYYAKFDSTKEPSVWRTAVHEKAMMYKHAATKIGTFVSQFSALKISDLSDDGKAPRWVDWRMFISNCGIANDWQTRTHFKDVLGLFDIGVDNDTAQDILTTEIEDGDGKKVTLQDHSVTWLSKALCAFKVGIMTDFVNLMSAVNGTFELQKNGEPRLIESVIADVIKEKRVKWVPEVLLIDGEKDDLYVWLFCLNLGSESYNGPRVLVQLPSDKAFDPLEELFLGFDAEDMITEVNGVKITSRLERMGIPRRVTVFRDPDSTNGEALKKTYGL